MVASAGRCRACQRRPLGRAPRRGDPRGPLRGPGAPAGRLSRADGARPTSTSIRWAASPATCFWEPRSTPGRRSPRAPSPRCARPVCPRPGRSGTSSIAMARWPAAGSRSIRRRAASMRRTACMSRSATASAQAPLAPGVRARALAILAAPGRSRGQGARPADRAGPFPRAGRLGLDRRHRRRRLRDRGARGQLVDSTAADRAWPHRQQPRRAAGAGARGGAAAARLRRDRRRHRGRAGDADRRCDPAPPRCRAAPAAGRLAARRAPGSASAPGAFRA